MVDISKILSNEFSIDKKYVDNVINLLDDGNTVPFISRYRKEMTGSLDDIVLREFELRLQYLRNLEEKKQNVIRLIDEQGKLTDKLKVMILDCKTLVEIEDIYRPFKPKKRTRAIIAEEKGLKPLSEIILSGDENIDIFLESENYINLELGVKNGQDALNGAKDIIAEIISDNYDFRKFIREYIFENGILQTQGESEERTQYEIYYEYSEKLKTIPSHRILAINRGEKENVLKVKVNFEEDVIVDKIYSKMKNENKESSKIIFESIEDSLKRLIIPSVIREIRKELSEVAEDGAIIIFKENLKALLMQPPIKGKFVMAVDPGFRTGCKVCILDDMGKYLTSTAIYPNEPFKKVDESKKILKELIYDYNVNLISLGNGTASRETEEIIGEVIQEVKDEKNIDLSYVIVSEAGASVYSASELASKEYPNLDVTVRGAISIGRRLQDPLVELVKIDPKSIGVGQYQHDINSKKLEESLRTVIEDCVNSVGVDLNIATPAILSYISGINSSIAENIVKYREENGKFKNRNELLKVKRLGNKVYEQCVGFLRISDGDNGLDNTSVHPESYDATKKFLEILNLDIDELKYRGKIDNLDERLKNFNKKDILSELGIGEITLDDIIKELKKPARDPREDLPIPIFKKGVLSIEDLKEGMILTGTVRNISDFGAFVDIGVHQDGLVHKSQMSHKFVKHPLDVVKLNDVVDVKVIDIDIERNRISLTMKI
ncbi:Tex family protein [Candidatus Arthromitus sp. SFB-turkey]|uniref:Tex family protein n=1 Tax=Candidatus Arthromitus sp. SFB-turkey TaxID=1840217 RepID=UPI0007F55FF3|nr:Tex family protein [Candidatus Arthromitus sp. SFB-turkey]OAT90010.1 RNA-binding transcriptional accessory protein [Candidatus Arthromitus sp. SFB-turkey]